MQTICTSISRRWAGAGRPATALLVISLLFAGCNNSNNTSEPNPKQACIDANKFQVDATALENAIRPATDADVPTLNNQAASLSHEISVMVSSGEAAGTNVNNDLTGALNAVNKIITDLSTPNLAQAKVDVDVLRNAMITLGQDCSQYLS